MRHHSVVLPLLFLLILLSIKKYQVCGEYKTAEGRLLSHLFDDYNPNARPVKKAKDPVVLSFDIALRQLLDFNERRQIMTTNVWIRHYWSDPLLSWNSSDWENITYLAVDPSLLWKPDITLYNNAEREFQGFDDFGKTRINIYSGGLVMWLIPIILRSQCRMDLTYFPFDSQVCPLIFGSWAFDGGSLDFINRNPVGDLSAFSESGEFLVHDLTAERISTIYGCCPNPYYTIEYKVNLKRKVKFYLYNLVIPGILIALLTCFSFFLPPLSGERTGLIITNFLSISVYIMMISDSVPPSSNVPLLVKFYTALIAEIGLALILNCLIIPLANRSVPMPQFIRVIFLEKLGCIFLCRRADKRIQVKNYKKKKSNLTISNSFVNDDVYFARNAYKNGHVSNGYVNGGVDHNKQNGSARGEDHKLRERIKSIVKDENSEVCDKLQQIIDMMDEEVQAKKHCEDWETLTIVLDRMFYLIFITSILITVSVLLNQPPEIHM